MLSSLTMTSGRVKNRHVDYYVYRWVGPSGAYIGKGRDGRAKAHLAFAAKGRTDCPRFYNAIRAHGAGAFSLQYLSTGLTESQALLDEVLCIFLLEPEYNLTAGGDGISGAVRSPETTAKMSAALKGRAQAPEHTEKVRAALQTPEVKAKLSACQIGKRKSAQHRASLSAALTGRKASPETRAKMSAARLGKEITPETRARCVAAQARRRGGSLQERLTYAVDSWRAGDTLMKHALRFGVHSSALSAALKAAGWICTNRKWSRKED